MEWTKVEDKLPFDDLPDDWKKCVIDDFLVVIGHDDPNDGDTVTVYEYGPRGWCYLGGYPTSYAKNVTHWMALPEPPKCRLGDYVMPYERHPKGNPYISLFTILAIMVVAIACMCLFSVTGQ